jgi:hypothetical protein
VETGWNSRVEEILITADRMGFVHVKCFGSAEIVLPRDGMRTLYDCLRKRGLWFDIEMAKPVLTESWVAPSGQSRGVSEIINVPNPDVILDGMTYGGNCSYHWMFCRRREYAHPRETGLKRIDETRRCS